MIHLAMVEDENTTVQDLKNYLKRYSMEKKVEFQISTLESSELLLSNMQKQFDLILLDIQLPGMDGMKAAQQIRHLGYTTPIIFVTSLAQYAVNGYEVDALDFMVKPVSYFQFAMKMEKAIRIIRQKIDQQISITVDRGIKVFSASQLTYIEIINHDLIYHSLTGLYRSRGSLSALEEKLSVNHFIRINVCYLVNMRYISELTSNSVILSTGDELFISRARKKAVLLALTEYLGGIR